MNQRKNQQTKTQPKTAGWQNLPEGKPVINKEEPKEIKGKLLPVDHLSYSSFMQLLRNPLIFKLKEILGVYNSKMSVSAVIGRACHYALEFYYTSATDPDRLEIAANPAENRARARQAGLDYITTIEDSWIEYGKTGSREEILKGYAQAMEFYWAEEPEYHEILSCEQKLSAEMKTVDGDILPLPGTGIPDLVVKNNKGEVEIIDTKFTKSFTDFETEDYGKIIQSQFLFHLVKGALNVTPTRMVFREIKRTKNADGGPQVRDWVVPYNHQPYFVMFYNLYSDVVKYLQNNPVFLPNLSDPFDGEHAGLMYVQGLISADMSDVEVMHKVKDVAFISKKFVGSNLDRAENKNLPPEERIKMRLAEFGIPVEPAETIVGAQVTQYRFKVSAGIRMATIQKHRADIERTLASKGQVRILTPVPGTEYVGIEVENTERAVAKLTLKHLTTDSLLLPLGVDVNGESYKIDLREMPHLLLAGATGSGKSVALNTIIEVLTKQMLPAEMQLILVDPKRVELTKYAKKPHLRNEAIIYDHREAIKALLELKNVMEERYKILTKASKRDLAEYNEAQNQKNKKTLPYIVCVIDEFADLILQGRAQTKHSYNYQAKSGNWLIKQIIFRSSELEYSLPENFMEFPKNQLVELIESIDRTDVFLSPEANVELLVARLAQLGRAAGIHLVLATQRPSVDVITGLIKANFPTRIAFRTSSPTDSIVILGEPGAEKLAGKGDMLLMGPMVPGGKVRLQGLITK